MGKKSSNTTVLEDQPNDVTEDGLMLGTRLRQRRQIRRMSLQELSRRSGLSIALLSQIERNVSMPSIRSLRQVCEGLGMPMNWLFEEGARENSGVIVRSAHRRRLDFGPYKMSKEMLSPDSVSGIQMIRIVIQPGGSSGEQPYNNPEGAKCGLVLSGVLGLHVADKEYSVEAGDSFAFQAEEMHRFWCVGDAPVELIWVVTPALY